MANCPPMSGNKEKAHKEVEGLDLVTADEAAKNLRISRRYLHGLAREGKISCVQYSSAKRFFRPEDIEAFIRDRCKPVTPPKRIDTTSQKLVPSSREVQSSEVSRAQLREEMRRWRSK